jgi:hypothetical protein
MSTEERKMGRANVYVPEQITGSKHMLSTRHLQKDKGNS